MSTACACVCFLQSANERPVDLSALELLSLKEAGFSRTCTVFTVVMGTQLHFFVFTRLRGFKRGPMRHSRVQTRNWCFCPGSLEVPEGNLCCLLGPLVDRHCTEISYCLKQKCMFNACWYAAVSYHCKLFILFGWRHRPLINVFLRPWKWNNLIAFS